MCDAVAAEDLGVPTAVLCTTAVLDVVRGALATYRLPELPVMAIEASLFGLSRDEIAAAAAPAVASLPRKVCRLRGGVSSN